MSNLKYRSEIDGLRAIAVIPVILFHAGFNVFGGGFVGVDVFFVISGYLITTIIAQDLQKDQFSLLSFYERRARRILPALALVALITSVFSYFILFPNDFSDFSKSLIGLSTFTSNIFFWRDSGYFSSAAELKPMIHTWSLAVEEQFYIFFPLFFMLVWTFGKQIVLISLVLIFLLSLSLAEWGTHHYPTASFFLLPTRGWEIVIGSLCAIYILQYPQRKMIKFAGLIGLFLIIYSVFFFNVDTPTPSLYTLVPTLGAALIILYSNKQTIEGRLLSRPFFVGIGLASYSAYLWHQPIFALLRHVFLNDLNLMTVMAALIMISILSYLTLRFIERPFRRKNIISKQIVLIFSVCFILLFSAIGSIGVMTNGMSWRFNLPSSPTSWGDIQCDGKEQLATYEFPLTFCLGSVSNNQSGDIYLIGDSHATQLTFPLFKIAEKYSKEFNFINIADDNEFPRSFLNSEQVKNDTVFDHILNVSNAGDLLIVAFHKGRFNKLRDEHILKNSKIEKNAHEYNFINNFNKYAKLFQEKGLKVVLIKDGPMLEDRSSLEACLHRYQKNGSSGCQVSYKQDLITATRQNRVFDQIKKHHHSLVNVIDPLPTFYDGRDTFDPITYDGQYLMFDQHHLTELGSLKALELFEAELKYNFVK